MISHFVNASALDGLKSLLEPKGASRSKLSSGYFLAAALALGYAAGSLTQISVTPETKSFQPSKVSPMVDPTTKLRQRLDDARDRLQLSLENAERVDNLATMQWIKTGKFEDRHHMNVAKDATDGIRAAINYLE